MLRYCLCIILLACVVGCDSGATRATAVESTVDRADVETIAFAGDEWFFDAPADYLSDCYRPAMDHFAFTRPGSDLRLLVVRLPTTGSGEGVYESLMRVQRLGDDGKRWISHGPHESHFQNGKFTKGTYQNGKLDGMDRSFWPNGNTETEVPYVNGQRNGVGSGWREDGTLMWTATYVDDEEVE